MIRDINILLAQSSTAGNKRLVETTPAHEPC